MGTTVIPSITTRKAMVDYLLETNSYGGYEVLDKSQKGNILYVLFKHPKDYKFIAVFKLSGPSRQPGDEGWGYKDMDESMGPCYYDCPERILAQSDDTSEGGTQWRENCRKYRKERAVRREWAKSLKPGDTVQYAAGWDAQGQVTRPVTFERTWSNTFFVGRDEEGRFRFRWDHLVMPAEAAAQAA